MVSREVKALIVTGVGAVVTVVAAVLGFYGFPKIVRGELEKELRLDKQGSEGYKNFQETPIEILMKFFLFNITNWDDAEADGKNWKPTVEQLGPYTYVEKRYKENITFINDNNEVEFYQMRVFSFDQERSGPGVTEDDELMIINAPVLGVLEVAIPVLDDSYLASIASMMRDEENAAFLRVKAKEIIFSGTETKFLSKLINFLGTSLGETLSEMLPPLPTDVLVPLGPRTTGFAYYPKNATAEGPFTVYTGKDGFDKYQDFKTFMNQTHLQYWNDKNGTRPEDSCNFVRGTDGTVFKPYMTKSSRPYIYDTSACRPLFLEYEKEVSFRGIDGYRYILATSQFESYETNPDNLCLCIPDESGCMDYGLYNLISCMHIPVYLSMPHFLNGADKYFNAIDGLERDPESHTTFIEVEPFSGIPLRAAKRMQMSFKVNSYNQSSRFPEILKHLPDNVILPIVWIEQSGELSKELADEYQSRIGTPLEILGIVKWVLLGIGILVILVGTALYINAWRRRRTTTV